MSCDNCKKKCDTLTIPTGTDGQNQYLYIGYADDSNGNGFTTDPNNNKKWVSFVQTTSQQTNDKSLHDNQGKWVKYLGDDGSTGSTASILTYDNTTTTTSNQSLTSVKSESLSAGTLDTDGDTIRIKSAVRKNNLDDELYMELRIWEGSATTTFYTNKINRFQLVESEVEGILDVQFQRDGSDAASADTNFRKSEGDLYTVTGQISFFDTPTDLASPLAFDNQTLEVEVFIASGQGKDVHCDHLSIELIEKS